MSGAPLQGKETATTARVRDGETITTDGPFAETKEIRGGYYLIDVDDLDRSMEWAARIPLAPYGSVEVPPLMVLPGSPGCRRSAGLLADQDRTRWDQAEIALGLAELARAHAMGRAGPYQFQAAIAALHATAPSVDATDWPAVVRLDDVMLGQQAPAIVALNRAVAVSHADGPAAGLAAIDAIAGADDLEGDLSAYPYFHSARGETLLRLGRWQEAADSFRVAIDVCRNDPEATHLRARLDAALVADPGED